MFLTCAKWKQEWKSNGKQRWQLKFKTSMRKEKQSWKSHLMTLPHSQHLKQNPHSPLMKHVPHMCKMKAIIKVKLEAKMTIEVQNWSIRKEKQSWKSHLLTPHLQHLKHNPFPPAKWKQGWKSSSKARWQL